MPAKRADYVPVPFVGEPYRDSGYGRTLAQLLMQRGEQQAAIHLQRGDAQARLWQGAGNAINQAVSGWQQSVEQNRQREIDAAREARTAEAQGLQIQGAKMTLAEAQRVQKGREFTRQVLPLARREDGLTTYDRDVLTREFDAAGMSDQLPEVFAKLDEQDSAHLQVLQARRDAVAGDAFRVLQSGASEESFAGLLEYWKANDALPARELKEIEKLGKQPETRQQALLAAVQSSPKFTTMLAELRKANEPDLQVVAPGSSVVDKRNPGAGAIFTAPDKPNDPNNIEQAILQATDPAKRAELIALKEQFARADRAPAQPAMPSFQRAEVLNDAGVPVMANFDARTGRYIAQDGSPIQNPRPVPGAQETQDARKFDQAGPILGAVSELSEKINTQQGLLAKMAGGAGKLAAKANYDDDIAEYEALISGFTPLVARALGHTGVLTQQDVDSVKALFPKPGDSKTLRDRKITRIEGIVGKLKAGAKTATPQAPPPAEPKDDAGWMDVDGFKVRVKP